MQARTQKNLGTYVTVFVAISIDTKIENSDTANLKASTCDIAVCVWILSQNISIHLELPPHNTTPIKRREVEHASS